MSHFTPARAARLDALLEQIVGTGRVAGIQLLVAEDGGIAYRAERGFADREAGAPVTKDSLFRIASLTKPMVSATALALVEAGQLGLDDVVSDYLPWFRPALADGARPQITVRQLLTHTSGLSYSFMFPADAPYAAAGVSDGMDNPGITLETNLRRLASVPLRFAPGERFHYSLSTDVLGAVIAAAADAPLPDVVARHIIRPLGLVDTAFVAASPERLTTPYHSDADPAAPAVRMPDPKEFPSLAGGLIRYSPSRATDQDAYPSGGVGLVSKADEYLVFAEALRTGRAILSPEMARMMTSDALAPLVVDAAGAGWGFGLGVGVLRDREEAKVPFSNGTYRWAGVWGANFWVDPNAGITIVSLTNTVGAGANGALPIGIIDAVFG